MGVMNTIVDLCTTGGVASALGLLGGLASKYTELKSKKLDYEHEIRMRGLDVAEAKQERSHELAIADKQVERAEVEGELAVQQIDASAFLTSQKGNNPTGWLTVVRPLITGYLLIACTAIFIVVWNKVGGFDSYSPGELKVLLADMVQAALYLTIICVSWWFASRGGNITKRK